MIEESLLLNSRDQYTWNGDICDTTENLTEETHEPLEKFD